MSFFQNTCKPSGLGGRLMVKMMNSGHAKLADWGFSQIQAKADARVLDAGCGGGANVAVWLKQCPKGRVTGMDYSEISVAETRKINDAAIKAGRCDVVQGNAAAMSFQAETFDVVSAFETVYFWPGLEACFAEVNRVMKRRGTFMICNECDGTNAADEKWGSIPKKSFARRWKRLALPRLKAGERRKSTGCVCWQRNERRKR